MNEKEEMMGNKIGDVVILNHKEAHSVAQTLLHDTKYIEEVYKHFGRIPKRVRKKVKDTIAKRMIDNYAFEIQMYIEDKVWELVKELDGLEMKKGNRFLHRTNTEENN